MSLCLTASALLPSTALSSQTRGGRGTWGRRETPLSSAFPLGSQAISHLREKPVLHLLFSVWALVASTVLNGEREKYHGPLSGEAGVLCPLSDVVSQLGASVEWTTPPLSVSVL